MKEELKVFENRSDDWLAKERKYEESISAWDLDEGYKLKSEHQKHCEAKAIEKEHEEKHDLYNATHSKGVISDRNQFESLDSSSVRKIIIFMALIPVIIVLVMILNVSGVIASEGFSFVIPIVIFIILVNLFSNKKGRNK